MPQHNLDNLDNLGSATELLRKQTDPEKRTRILDQIDREAVTQKLMEMLEIRNQEDAQIGITKALVHVLLNDYIFSSFNQAEKDIACEKILEDVRGRMLEDIILLETVRTLPKKSESL